MSDDHLWGSVVRDAIAAANQATPFGKRIGHGVAFRLPSSSPEAQYLAVEHLLNVVASLQTLVQLLADELDRREGAGAN